MVTGLGMMVSMVNAYISKIGLRTIHTIQGAGSFLLFLRETGRQMITPPYRFVQILRQMEFIGNQSLSVIGLSAFFVGAVFSLQIGVLFKLFRAEGLMGAVTGKALARELAPMLTGFLLSGRAGSAITAEIATMKVSEQVDAMEAMAVEPIHYLVVPRLIAMTFMAPILSFLFVFIGELGSYVVAVMMFDVDQAVYFGKITTFVRMEDIWSGGQKALAFGAIVSLVACRYGLTATGGAKGVGKSTTNSVVMTLLILLICDFIMTYFQMS